MSGTPPGPSRPAPRSREGELLKKEKGPLGARWTRKLVVVDGQRGTVRYHKPTDDKTSVPRKIFHLKSMTLGSDVGGPKKAPHAFELRDAKGYSLVLACERGAAEKEAWRSLLAPLCSNGAAVNAQRGSDDWVEDEAWPAQPTFDQAKSYDTFEATFLPNQPLGIQLRLEPENEGRRPIAVLAVKDTCPCKDAIRSGDELVGVLNEPPLLPQTTDAFKACTTELARKPRPLVLVFRREAVLEPSEEASPSPRSRAATFDDAPPIDDEPVRLNATFDAPPSNVTLALAQVERERPSVRIESVGDARRQGLQVLDDLVALDADDLTLITPEAALERVTARLGRGPFPCRVGILRRLSVFSLEFPDDQRPLGVVLRLVTPPDGPSRVIVEAARDDGPAASLEPRNDELVAVAGAPVPRDCGPVDFDALLGELKGASRPLSLTFVRSEQTTHNARAARVYGQAIIGQEPGSAKSERAFEEQRAAQLFGDDRGWEGVDFDPQSDADQSSEGTPVGVDDAPNVVEPSDDAAAVSDGSEPDVEAPSPPFDEWGPASPPSKLAAFMATTPNPASPPPRRPQPTPPPPDGSPGDVGRQVIEQVASFGDAPSAALELEAVRAELETSARALARAREERSAAVRELEEVAEDARFQREKVGKLESERSSLESERKESLEFGKENQTLKEDVDGLRKELASKQAKNQELEASTRARDASLEALRKKLQTAELLNQQKQQAAVDRRASLVNAEDNVVEKRSKRIEEVCEEEYVNGDCSGEELAVLLEGCVTPAPSKTELVAAFVKVVPEALQQPFWCDADEAGSCLSRAPGDWVEVLEVIVDAVALNNFEASLPLLFGALMSQALEPRKLLSTWRRRAAATSTQIGHEKRSICAEALRRTDAWFDGDGEEDAVLEPVFEFEEESVETIEDDKEPVTSRERSVAQDLRRALDANASLDNRGAALAKKIALIKPRPRGSKVLEALLEACPAPLIFGGTGNDAQWLNATWAQPARCGAALEALSEFDPTEQARMCRALERYCSKMRRSDALSSTLRCLVDYDVLEDQGVNLWRDTWGDDALLDAPAVQPGAQMLDPAQAALFLERGAASQVAVAAEPSFLPSPRAVLLERSDDEEDEPGSPVDRAIADARRDISERVTKRLAIPAASPSPQLEEALESSRRASQAAAEALDAANSSRAESRTIKAQLARAASSEHLEQLQQETLAKTSLASTEATQAKQQADEASKRAQRAEAAAATARDEAQEARRALANAVAESDKRQHAIQVSYEEREDAARARHAAADEKLEQKLAALHALEERLLRAARDEAKSVAEEVSQVQAARVARDAASDIGERTASIVEAQQREASLKLQEETTAASARVDAKFAELDERIVEATTPRPFPQRTPVARPSSSEGSETCVNLGESLESLQLPTITTTPSKCQEVRGLPARAQAKLRERFLRLLRQPSGPLLDDDGCLVRVRVEHGYEGSKGKCRVEITNVSQDRLEDLKIDAFADDEPTLVVSTRLEEDIQSLEPGASVTCRVSCVCRAPFVVPPELAVRFACRGARYAYALRLPVAVTCFAQPDGYNARDVGAFRRRWDECGGFDGAEKQVVVAARGAVDADALDDVRQRIVCDALRGALVRGADPTPATATAATLINTTDDGAVDVLVRLEANAAARAFRVTVRSPSPAAAAAFKNVLQALLTSYFVV